MENETDGSSPNNDMREESSHGDSATAAASDRNTASPDRKRIPFPSDPTFATRMATALDRGDTDTFMACLQIMIFRLAYENDATVTLYTCYETAGMLLTLSGLRGHYVGNDVLVAENARYAYMFAFVEDESPDAALRLIANSGADQSRFAGYRRTIKVGASFSAAAWNITKWKVGGAR